MSWSWPKSLLLCFAGHSHMTTHIYTAKQPNQSCKYCSRPSTPKFRQRGSLAWLLSKTVVLLCIELRRRYHLRWREIRSWSGRWSNHRLRNPPWGKSRYRGHTQRYRRGTWRHPRMCLNSTCGLECTRRTTSSSVSCFACPLGRELHLRYLRCTALSR